MTSVIPARGSAAYVCVPCGRGWFAKLRVIAWETTGDAPATPITIKGRATAPWLLLDDGQFLLMPDGYVFDSETQANLWLNGRLAAA